MGTSLGTEIAKGACVTFAPSREGLRGELMMLKRVKVSGFWSGLVALGVALSAGIGTGCSRAPDAAQTTGNLTPTTKIESSSGLLALGKTTFERNCAPC